MDKTALPLNLGKKPKEIDFDVTTCSKFPEVREISVDKTTFLPFYSSRYKIRIPIRTTVGSLSWEGGRDNLSLVRSIQIIVIRRL